LIKPVQRVLRYPLFLQQIKAQLADGTPEFLQISEALTKMERVAEYINEMQRIYEEHGDTFESLQQKWMNSGVNLDLNTLLMCGEVEWLNAGEDSANGGGNSRKKSSQIAIECVCFVFETAIVLLGNKDQKIKKSKVANESILQRVIPINEVEVNGSDQGSTDQRFLWVLIHIEAKGNETRERIYHFSNRRPEVKSQFLKAIRRAGMILSKEIYNNGSAKAQSASNLASLVSNSQTSSKDSKDAKDATRAKDDETTLSGHQPSSSFLPPPPPPLNGNCADSGMQKNCSHIILPNGVKRSSFYSSQSDAGYVSNNDIPFCSRKECV